MTMTNVLNHVHSRSQLRQWLEVHHSEATECWVPLSRANAPVEGILWYLDAVEEALCFGWIDSTLKKVDGVCLQRLTPRSARSKWSELNKERCRRLERLGLMTDAGRSCLPDMDPAHFTIDPEIIDAFKRHPDAWRRFSEFPPLYQRVRIDTIQRDKRDRAAFLSRLARLIEQSSAGLLYGSWHDHHRLHP